MEEANQEFDNSKNFVFSGGKEASTIEELLDLLPLVSDEDFNSHVNSSKNDMADWIEHVFNENILSNLIRKADKKETMVTIIKSFLETKEEMNALPHNEQTTQIPVQNPAQPIIQAQSLEPIQKQTAQPEKPVFQQSISEPSPKIDAQKEAKKEEQVNTGPVQVPYSLSKQGAVLGPVEDRMEEFSKDTEEQIDKESDELRKEMIKEEPIQPKKPALLKKFQSIFNRKKETIQEGDEVSIEDNRTEQSQIEEIKIHTPEFIKLDIPGFDELITNGIPKGSSVLISGGAGTGKTTFCLHLLASAAMKGEKCLYLTFEEEPSRLRSHMKNYGWDAIGLEEKGNLMISKMDAFQISRSVEGLLAQARGELVIKLNEVEGIIPEGFNPDRIVLDSLSAVSAAFVGKEEGYRIYVKQLFDLFKKSGATSFLIDEIEENASNFSSSGVEGFLADSVILFYNLRQKSVRVNAIEVVKLRGTSHKKKIVPFKIIAGQGIKVFPKEDPFIE